MASDYSPTTISSGYASTSALNEEFQNIKTAMDKLLSREGTSPNQMEVDFDMNSNQILNVGTPQNGTDAARLQDILDNASSLASGTALTTSITDSNEYYASSNVEAALEEAALEWKYPRTATYASATTFTTDTTAVDDAGEYIVQVGRRVRGNQPSGWLYGTITGVSGRTSSSTVTVAWDSGSLANESLTVWFGVVSVENTSSPVASATVKGQIEIATSAEVAAGTDTERAVTPAGLASLLASLQPQYVSPDGPRSTLLYRSGAELFIRDRQFAMGGFRFHGRYSVERAPVFGAASYPTTVDLGTQSRPAADLTLSATTGAGITVTASASIFAAGQVGEYIYAFTGTGAGITGLAVITAYTSGTEVTADVISDFTGTSISQNSWAQNSDPGDWAMLSAPGECYGAVFACANDGDANVTMKVMPFIRVRSVAGSVVTFNVSGEASRVDEQSAFNFDDDALAGADCLVITETVTSRDNAWSGRVASITANDQETLTLDAIGDIGQFDYLLPAPPGFTHYRYLGSFYFDSVELRNFADTGTLVGSRGVTVASATISGALPTGGALLPIEIAVDGYVPPLATAVKVEHRESVASGQVGGGAFRYGQDSAHDLVNWQYQKDRGTTQSWNWTIGYVPFAYWQRVNFGASNTLNMAANTRTMRVRGWIEP